MTARFAAIPTLATPPNLWTLAAKVGREFRRMKSGMGGEQVACRRSGPSTRRGNRTFAEKLNATPTQLEEEDLVPPRSLRFDDVARLEVAHLVGLFNYLSRRADAFGLQPTETRNG